jgi:hypothetical protein
MSDLKATNQKASASQNVRTANDNYALYEADRVAKHEAQTAAKPESQNPREADAIIDNLSKALVSEWKNDRSAKVIHKQQTAPAAKPATANAGLAHTAETLEVWRQRAVDEANKVADREVTIAELETQRDELLSACHLALALIDVYHMPWLGHEAESKSAKDYAVKPIQSAIAKVEAGQ